MGFNNLFAKHEATFNVLNFDSSVYHVGGGPIFEEKSIQKRGETRDFNKRTCRQTQQSKQVC